MKNFVRVFVSLFALVVLATTVVISETPAGNTYDVRGIVIDLVALFALAVVAATWIRERRRLR